MKRKTLVGLIAIVAIVAVVIFAGCVEEEKSPVSVSTQDFEYAQWGSDTLHTVGLDMELAANAAERFDFEGVETYSGMLYDDAKKALYEIDQYDVSPALKPSKDEFRLALQDLKQAGYYGERGARNYDADDLETSGDYLESAAKHLNRAAALMPKE